MALRVLAALLLAVAAAARGSFVEGDATSLVQQAAGSSQPGEAKRLANKARLKKHQAEGVKQKRLSTYQEEEEAVRFQANAHGKQLAAAESARTIAGRKSAHVSEVSSEREFKDQDKKAVDEERKRLQALKTAEHLKNEHDHRKIKNAEKERLRLKKEEADRQEKLLFSFH
eukprot:CAMPEP_0171169782 /NCGR_PEP_ID=MMETSP0790-20130122/8385_1 /TAXON_ID=2925 /ORGANISM="Alexandrium catenella, Strain OF101" /LENGTH=170 /DNA_ID=CAMNT_0011634627 /DNA_START=92 /DNA_END=604 /DNA_ORIENTATION=-